MYQSRFAVPLLAAAVATTADAQQLRPIPRDLPDGVTVHRDQAYATYGDRQLLLDLYLPADLGDTPLPSIVVIRGGGWAQGDKEGFGPIAAALATQGFAAASIEYRASGEAVFPAAVEDAKAAVRWLRANAARFNLDADAIGAFGGSAGAHIAAYLGATANVAAVEGQGGNQDQSSAVAAVVALAVPGDLRAAAGGAPVEAFLGSTYAAAPELWRDASPIVHVDAASAPLLLIHSQTDNVVDFDQSLELARAYAAAGVPVELVRIADAPHPFWNFTRWFADTMDRSATFFRERLTNAR